MSTEAATMGESNKRSRGLDATSGPGVVYVPPAKRRQMMLLEAQKNQQEGKVGVGKSGDEQKEQIKGGESLNSAFASDEIAIQRESWQEQKRIIHGTINRLNAGTIKPLIHELFQKVNLIRMRGVLCKSVLLAAVSAPKYSDVYAALIAVINSKLPQVGELMVKRSILAFRRYFKQRDKASCQAVCVFLVHLFHQGVVHELIILQLMNVLLDGRPTNEAVEVAVHVLQIAGQALLESSPAGVRACTERLRTLLHEGNLNKRVEYRMEELLKLRKAGFKGFPPIIDELDLVERDDQITFEITLDDEDIRKEENLDVFSPNPDFEEQEAEWKTIRAEILGEVGSSDDDDDESSGSDDDSSQESENEVSKEAAEESNSKALVPADTSKQIQVIQDLTEADLVHLRRTIYLTIMSSASFEECAHKLARINIPDGRESELINMLIECCSQERTFLRYYGLVAARFCLMDDRWRDAFMRGYEEQYTTIHRLETNKLRNVAKLFAHLLHSDSIPWSVLSIIHLNEDETTSSSRIFIKIVIQEMAEAMGIAKLKERFETTDEEQKLWYAGMFPKDNVRNTRYAINFFTSIGLGPLTDDLREFLKNAPKLIMQQAKAVALAKKDDDSDESSSVSSTSSSSSSFSSSSSSFTSSSSSYTSSSSCTSSSSSDSELSSRRSQSSYSSESRDRRNSRGSKRRRRIRESSRSRSSSRSDDRRKSKGSKSGGRDRSESAPISSTRKEKSSSDRKRTSRERSRTRK
ncbi:MA3 domain containing protein [Nitzschia inconspicua]|uniref:MA3 domain containing protein n=1 Tax=Nitzschia inconspicua TaxID=303405 RepID=A0A9K3KY60_9STRA|nr:MA3 domain containing protein [Nitzschia inconspicua]